MSEHGGGGHGGGGEGGGGGSGGMLGSLFYKLGFSTDTKPIESLEAKLEGIQHRLEFLGAAEVVKGIFELTEKFSGFAEQLSATAFAAGIGVEQLQTLQFAASQSAVGADEINNALGHLSRTLYAAREGGDEAVKSFAAIGISAEQIKGFKTSTEAFDAISDRMRNIPDPIKRVALSMQVLGRGSRNLAKFMGEGSVGIHAMQAEAVALGAVLSEEDVHKLAEVEDTLSAAGQVVRTLSASFAAAFAPAIQTAVQQMMAFYGANRQVIGQHFQDWVGGVLFALGYLHGTLQQAAQAVFDFAAAYPELTKNAGYFVVGLFSLLLGLLAVQKSIQLATGSFGLLSWAIGPIPNTMMKVWGAFKEGGAAVRIVASLSRGLLYLGSVVPVVGSAFTYMGTLLAATPIGWLVAGVVALTLAMQSLYTVFYEGKPFKESWLGRAIEFLRGLGGKALKLIGLSPGDIPDAAGTAASSSAPAGPQTLDFAGDGKASSPPAGPKTLDFAADEMQRKFSMIGQIQTMASSPAPAGASMSGVLDFAHPEAPGTLNFSAPVTINVPQGGDAKMMAEAAKAAIKDHLDQKYREARRGLTPAQVN